MRITTIGLLLLLLGAAGGSAMAEPLRDPLRPSGFSAAKQGSTVNQTPQKEPVWVLSAVLYSDQRLVAILNGQTVQIGDLLEGYRVKSIARDKVVLTKKARTIVVPRAGTGLKRAATAAGAHGKKGNVQ